MSRRAITLLTVAALVIAGCSSDADSQATTAASSTSSTTEPAPSTTVTPTTVAPTSTTSTTAAPTTTLAPTTTAVPTTVAPTTTIAAPTTTAAPATTTTVAPATCPAPAAVPAGAIETAAELIDVDADGLADTVRSYAAASPPGAGDWHLRVELAGGGGSDLTLPFDPAPAGVVLLGGAYVGSNVDPGPEGARPALFVQVGAGASVMIIGLYRLSGCNLIAMPNAAFASPAEFEVGATVMRSSDLRCEGVAGTSLLVFAESTYDDVAMVYNIIETPYTRAGDELVLFAGPSASTSPTPPPGGGLSACGIALP